MTANPVAIDHVHMARALQLAARGTYSTAPNPAVGCVLLDATGAVVGEGWHHRAGQPHAEVLALQRSSRPRTWRHGVRHARAVLAPRTHAALCRCTDRGGRAAGRRSDAGPQPACRGRWPAQTRSRWHRHGRWRTRTRSARAESRLRCAHDARTALGDGEAWQQCRRPHGARRRLQPVDHVGARARRRATSAGTRIGDRHRHRHGTRGRSCTDRS